MQLLYQSIKVLHWNQLWMITSPSAYLYLSFVTSQALTPVKEQAMCIVGNQHHLVDMCCGIAGVCQISMLSTYDVL